ncbi:hypothetical protein [uncultured Tenacibaculum sp.]|uniref:hypothetical protein n=1 Tax=uncultured Tenacibaculum sp. TaxID=174713 RepID=UPI002633051E|nr:hypothetical protein [uncultured Tenacibaculum sp.]
MIKSFLKSENLKSNILYLLRLICRYYIALQMFSYAFAKILKSQFDLGLSYLGDVSINSFNGFMLTWNYYGYSRTYGLIIASTQIIAAFLLLFRKTERIGVILFLSFMINILLVDIFYDIQGALSMAIKLSIMGVFLLISDWSGMKSYFLKFKIKTPLFPSILPEKLKNLYWIKFLVIGGMFFYGYNYISNIKKQFLVEKEIFGIYKAVPENFNERYFRVYFDYDYGLKIKDFNDNIYYGSFAIDSLQKSVILSAKCYTETGYFLVKDSLNKLNLPKDSIKAHRKEITNYYNKKRNSESYNTTFDFNLKNDTLILKNKETSFKLVNVTDKYKH